MRSAIALLTLSIVFASPAVARAQGKAAIAREAAEYVLGRFGKEAAREGLEGLTRKIEVLATKYGDEAIVAVKKVGLGTFRLVEEAGEHGLDAVKIMAKYGDDAVWVVAKKNRMAIFVKYGDNAAEAMMRHGEVAEPLLDAHGKSAAGALKAVSTRNGRRLAIMLSDGELARIGRTPELLDVVAKYGDRAMEFVWKNKGPLAVDAALAAFLGNPEPFIDGTADIAKVVADSEVKSLPTAFGQATTEAAKSIDWTLVAICELCVAGCLIGIRLLLRRSARGQWLAPSAEPGAAPDPARKAGPGG